MVHGIVYRVTNRVNGKQYVGQTVTTLRLRWNGHNVSRAGCPALHRAIVKYGRDNFTIEEIATAEDQEFLDFLEDECISFYRTMAPVGYNLKGGGANGHHSDLTKAKIGAASRALSGDAWALRDARIRAVGAKNKGRKASPDVIAARTRHLRGSTQSPEHVARRVSAFKATMASRKK